MPKDGEEGYKKFTGWRWRCRQRAVNTCLITDGHNSNRVGGRPPEQISIVDRCQPLSYFAAGSTHPRRPAVKCNSAGPATLTLIDDGHLAEPKIISLSPDSAVVSTTARFHLTFNGSINGKFGKPKLGRVIKTLPNWKQNSFKEARV